MKQPVRVMAYMRLARMPQAPRAWIYGRVASPDAFALQVQRKALSSYADRKEYFVVGTTVEHGSGTTMNRQGLNEVSRAASQGLMDVLVVKNLSRLGRNTQEVLNYIDWLETQNVEVVCTDGNGSVKDAVKFTRNLLTAIPASAQK